MGNFRHHTPSRRKSRGLPPKPLVLIVCEGKETEPNYFNGIRKRKRIPRDRIKVVGCDECGGTDPKTIVECAKKVRKQSELNYDEYGVFLAGTGTTSSMRRLFRLMITSLKSPFPIPVLNCGVCFILRIRQRI